jgi:SAM-dependent methyltransferase
VNREYFQRYCQRGPYAELWLDHSGAANCVATLRRTGEPVRSLVVLGAATGQVLGYFERALGARVSGCEISRWAHARIPARQRRRVARADLRRFVPRLAREGARFDLVFTNALVYLHAREVGAVLAGCARVARLIHFYSSTSEDHEPGDRWRRTLRPRAWWREQFLSNGWAPTRSPYLWRRRE